MDATNLMKRTMRFIRNPFQRAALFFLVCALVGTLFQSSRVTAAEATIEPFEFAPSLLRSNDSTWVEIRCRLSDHTYLYADRLKIALDGQPASFPLPIPKELTDQKRGKTKRVFDLGFTNRFALSARVDRPQTLSVEFQGCSDEECYFPETRAWVVNASTLMVKAAAAAEETSEPGGSRLVPSDFQIVARGTGYLDSNKFIALLNRARSGAEAVEDLPSKLGRAGLWATLALTLLGGLGLNLTPCVLPMIPINLAILGVGKKTSTRWHGFQRGLAYGSGMALAYGGLGLGVVLTGSRFGSLQSSPWFNFAMALVFAILSLAMFDKLVIDFSRFQSNASGRSNSSWFGAATLGGVSAMLAGACVAPVIVSVLLLSTSLYQQGHWLALLLPFVLGIGMALPWPLAASGLAFLPKPGAWMTHVKHVFGVLIIGFAMWYGWLGYRLALRSSGSGTTLETRVEDSVQGLAQALQESRRTHQPVVIDFWASWCKNCTAMEHSTFRSPTVQEHLQNVHFVRFQAEHLNDAGLKPILDEFGVLGLPTVLVLVPTSTIPSRQSVITKENRHL